MLACKNRMQEITLTTDKILAGLKQDKEDLENGNFDFDALAKRFGAYASVLHGVAHLATKPPKPGSLRAKAGVSGDELLWVLECIFVDKNRGQA